MMKPIMYTSKFFCLLCLILESAHYMVMAEPGKLLGCFIDQPARVLPGLTTGTKYVTFSEGMTPERCVDYCHNEGFQYAGVEYAQECFCGTEQHLASAEPADGCTTPCNGDTASLCGGTWRINIYRNLNYNGPLGCFLDQSDRVLPGLPTSTKYVTFSEGMTPVRCVNYCRDRGFAYAGVEYAQECFCGTAEDLVAAVPSDGCTTPCNGNAAFICGDTWKITIYRIPNNNGLLGCFIDQPARVLPGLTTGTKYVTFSEGMTPERCINYCHNEGFQYAGVEYAQECFCGTEQHLASAVPANGCTTPCSGDTASVCGGTWRINIYRVSQYNGPISCYIDHSDRVLPGLPTSTKYVTFSEGMTPARCLIYCQDRGFPYAGVEYAQECFCGTEQQLVSAEPEGGCTTACNGNAAFVCGGTWRINVYRV